MIYEGEGENKGKPTDFHIMVDAETKEVVAVWFHSMFIPFEVREVAHDYATLLSVAQKDVGRNVVGVKIVP